MDSTYFVYQDAENSYFVSKSENWKHAKKIAKIKAERVFRKINFSKTPIEVGAIGATTQGIIIKVKSVEQITL